MAKKKAFMNQKLKHWQIIVLIVFVIIMALIKYPQGDCNYLNSDATWHSLLTLKAYDETPIREHKFLPIVSLGDLRDKYISWGATIPDDKGNYYYTSFSPMGYMLPFFFIKFFHLEFSELSLYIFNTLLLMVSCIVIYMLMAELYSEKTNYHILMGVIVAYILAPETMHGMGIVYWSQSLMQVFLPLQLLFYIKYIKYNRKEYLGLLLFMCVINPYTEWSGYVANGGIFLAEIIRNKEEKGFLKIRNLIYIGVATILSFSVFCMHYIAVTDAGVFFNALKSRFGARNITTDVSLKYLFAGYGESYLALIIISFIFLFIFICKYKREGEIKELIPQTVYLSLFVCFFTLLENFIMKAHAVSYSYDRMKLALPLMIISYITIVNIMAGFSQRIKVFCVIIIGMVVWIPAMLYVDGDKYYWEIDYQCANDKLFGYINENYDDSVVGLNSAVRGYINMSMGRGVYEGIRDLGQLTSAAENSNCRYMVLLKTEDADGKDRGNMYKLSAEIYDREKSNLVLIENKNTDIQIVEAGSIITRMAYAADYVDEKWTQGISRERNIVLFNYNSDLLLSLKKASKFVVNDNEINILEVEYDDFLIRVKTDIYPDICSFPNEICIEYE